MSKSIKPSDNTYIDDSCVVHGRTPIKNILKEIKEEHIIGTTSENKPIYSKTIETTVSGVTDTTISLNINNLKEIWINFAKSRNHFGNNYQGSSGLNWYVNNDDNGVVWVTDTLSLGLRTRSLEVDRKYTIVVEYTKTTD